MLNAEELAFVKAVALADRIGWTLDYSLGLDVQVLDDVMDTLEGKDKAGAHLAERQQRQAKRR